MATTPKKIAVVTDNGPVSPNAKMLASPVKDITQTGESLGGAYSWLVRGRAASSKQRIVSR